MLLITAAVPGRAS